ncbi:MAG: glycosyl hydrolase [Gemmatimonadota bacterium]|nr:MAG: glycosyl hydrolase [Gemmatimonadota bacterium]
MRRVVLIAAALMQLSPTTSLGQDSDRMNAGTFSGLRLRNIGPAFMSGRIGDIVKDPTDPSVWYVAVASGNVWKTTNSGTTWTPIFDEYGSYSIGCLALDPNNPQVVWIGTGENASQRSAGYGDGIYKSLDGGRSWTNMGLRSSEHIGKVLIDPRDSDVVYVAAQGPLWAPGGDRGLYKTTDGGATWELALEISENTGVTDIAFDPRDPDIIYAASYQRRRHVGILVAGGPESAIYKSADGGATWKELSRGLPNVDIGRIALAVSPQNPDVVYALIAASGDESGFFRSPDRGEHWVRMSDYIVVDPQYYGEIYADPHQFDRVYAMDVNIHYTEDGGSTFQQLGSEFKHVDNHAFLFDPDDPEYLIVGSDGGIYESWDRGATWKYVANLPITQFYRVGLDNEFPFYNVYGGTQDNSTLGGPSRTTNIHGIRNSDWFITLGGDGFQTRIDPENPDILYSQYQYAGLVRYDRRSGERIDIQPQPEAGDTALRWHWDSPLIISPHASTRLYFAANKLFRSDDRGDTWVQVSPDLSRQLDRNRMEVMGTVWSVDAVWKNVFTSPFGTIVSLDESPLEEGLIYVGTDDGLIQVTEDAGANWRRTERFPGVPAMTYVADLLASRHDANTVYAVFNNHKSGDFNPYVVKSTDRGRNWRSITANLPDRHVTWSIAEDHVNPNLLFVATEFALFFSVDGGAKWIRLSGDVPTVAFRDLEVQRRENDLVAASFGRGFFILDDYTPLREVSEELLAQEACLFPVKDAWMYIQSAPLGWRSKGTMGHAYFIAPNPPFGAVFTYYLREGLKTRRQERQEEERRLRDAGTPVYYPSWDELRAEEREEDPAVIMTVRDEAGNVVRRIDGPASRGFHRVAWDLRHPAFTPARPRRGSSGPLAVPGTYTVSLEKLVDGVLTPLAGPQSFEARPLGLATLPASDKAALLAFQQKVGRLQRAVLGANRVVDETQEQLEYVKRALLDAPGARAELFETVRSLEMRVADIEVELGGDETVTSRFEYAPLSITDRLDRVVGGFWSSSAPTTTHQRNYEIAGRAFQNVLAQLRVLVEEGMKALGDELEAAGAPWTPGRGVPKWSFEPL